MSAANIAFLVIVLAAYGVFIVALGAVWLRSAFGDRKTAVTEAREPATSSAKHERRLAA